MADLENLARSIEVYPNPAQSNAKLYINLGKAKANALEILDPVGKTIQRHTLSTSSGPIEIDLNEKISAGIYFVKIAVEGTTINKKIIIE